MIVVVVIVGVTIVVIVVIVGSPEQRHCIHIDLRDPVQIYANTIRRFLFKK